MSNRGLNIGISARILSAKEGGVKRYVHNFIENLISLDKANTLYIFHSGNTKFFDPHNEIKSNSHSKIIFDYIFLPIETFKNKIDVMIFTKDVIPVSSYFLKTKKILIVYDVTYFIQGLDTYKFIDYIYNKIFIPISIKNSNHIITISQSSKNDLIRLFDIDQNKIDIIYPCVDSNKFHLITNKNKLNDINNKYGLNRPFVLYVGAIIPRKNILNLLHSFNQIKYRIPHDLVLVGGKEWKSKEIFKYIRQSNNDNRIKLLGHLSDSELVEIYNASEVFVFPSFYEGFGIPIIEAMACGTPVITSNTSSMPEVVGDAGIMVDPYDIDGLAKAMYEVLTNDGLKEIMIRKGLERAKMFSSDKILDKTLEVYEKVFNK